MERDGLVARAVRRGADAAAADDLLRRLVSRRGAGRRVGRRQATRRRAEAAVAVSGDGPLAVGVAAGLAWPGSGPCRSRGGGRGGPRGRPRHRPAGRRPGPARAEALPGRRAAGRAGRVGRAGPGAVPAPDLCVLADAAAPDPCRSPRCTAPGSRTCRSGCATGWASSGRWCCRVARRASAASSCTGAAAIPAGRPSPPSSRVARATASRGDGRHAALGVRRSSRCSTAAGPAPPGQCGGDSVDSDSDGGGDGSAQRARTRRRSPPAGVPPVLGATLELDLAGGTAARPWPAPPGAARVAHPRAGRAGRPPDGGQS